MSLLKSEALEPWPVFWLGTTQTAFPLSQWPCMSGPIQRPLQLHVSPGFSPGSHLPRLDYSIGLMSKASFHIFHEIELS